jgi:hypothetical protein
MDEKEIKARLSVMSDQAKEELATILYFNKHFIEVEDRGNMLYLNEEGIEIAEYLLSKKRWLTLAQANYRRATAGDTKH